MSKGKHKKEYIIWDVDGNLNVIEKSLTGMKKMLEKKKEEENTREDDSKSCMINMKATQHVKNWHEHTSDVKRKSNSIFFRQRFSFFEYFQNNVEKARAIKSLNLIFLLEILGWTYLYISCS